MSRFPIFMYHALWPEFASAADRTRHAAADPQLSDPGTNLYALERATFAAHLEALDRAGAASPRSWDELLHPIGTATGGAPARAWAWLTFDDGHRSNLEVALPLLEAHGRHAIFFITTDWIGNPGFMDAGGLRRLHAAGMMLGTHGRSHRLFDAMTREELRREMIESKSALEAILGAPAPAIALPGGSVHADQIELAREACYAHLFTSEMSLAEMPSGPFAPAAPANSSQPPAGPTVWPRLALTRRTPQDFVERLLRGDESQLRALARADRLRRTLRGMMGEKIYQSLRRRLLSR